MQSTEGLGKLYLEIESWQVLLGKIRSNSVDPNPMTGILIKREDTDRYRGDGSRGWSDASTSQ